MSVIYADPFFLFFFFFARIAMCAQKGIRKVVVISVIIINLKTLKEV